VATRAFRGCRFVRRLPVGVFAAISQDGNVIAGFELHRMVAVYRSSGELIARWSMELGPIALGEDGSWLAIHTKQGIEKWSVATQQLIDTWMAPDRPLAVAVRPSELRYWDGYLFGRDEVWRAADLSPVALQRSPTIPQPGRDGHACGSRFVASIVEDGMVLWDRVRERSVLHHRLSPGASLAMITLDGRFALAHQDDELVAIDLTTNILTHRVRLETIRPDFDLVAPSSGRYLLVRYSVVFASGLYELDWELDSSGDTDPLIAAWAACKRPPIVDAFMSRMDRGDPMPRAIARNHPELELELARRLPVA
jgi:hypothetical protein